MINIPYIAILPLSYVETIDKKKLVTNVALLLLAREHLDLKAFSKCPEHNILPLLKGVLKTSLWDFKHALPPEAY